MLFKKNNRPAVKGIILTSLLTLLTSCGNSTALESLVGANPELKKSKAEEVSDKTQAKPTQNSDSPDKLQTKDPAPVNNNVNDAVSRNSDASNNGESKAAEAKIDDLFSDFPNTFPVYPQAELQEIKSDQAKNSGMMIWNTTDNRKAVADYYQAELSTDGWKIIKPFTIDPKQKIARAIAVKDNLRAELSLSRSNVKQESESKNTKLSVIYHPLDQELPKSSISQSINSDEPVESATPATAENENKQPKRERENTESSQPAPKQNYFNSSGDFTDLNREVPEQLQQPLKSVAALGILTPYTGQSNVESKFAPNQIITRGEYARWLIAANNKYYSDDPGKKIYVAAKTDEPAFKDVKPSNPDFAAIQSLAEAGLIPSRLTEDSTSILFKPDAPLTREDLVTWKVPLDTRQALPKASIEAVKESWGFQDATDINSSAIRALYADFQNGDRSNIRRIFGYTTLFQPKKPVTRAEAAASLWYFGFQGDGITAKEVLDSEAKTES